MDGCVCTMDVYVLTVGETRIFEAERPACVKVLRLKRIQEAQAREASAAERGGAGARACGAL